MRQAITPIVARELKQERAEMQRARPAIQRIRHRQHVRQVAKAPARVYDFTAERRGPMADDASRFHDRASMLLVAEVRIASGAAQRVVLRNISATGLMVEMDEPPHRGSFVALNLGDLGWTCGTVVWRVGRRFGVMFDEAIDPASVRRTVGIIPQAPQPSPLRRPV